MAGQADLWNVIQIPLGVLSFAQVRADFLISVIGVCDTRATVELHAAMKVAPTVFMAGATFLVLALVFVGRLARLG